MKTKKGDKEKLREVILEKSILFFKKHGRSGSASDQVMTFMGLTRGALYSHFKSKDDLFVNAVGHDLRRLEESLRARIETEGPRALQRIIEDHLSEKSLKDVENGCSFTSLSSDMQRCKPAQRLQFEGPMDRIYDLFALMLREQFPKDSPKQSREKALNLYSGLVGTLTMARTMRDSVKAREILKCGREFLLTNFVGKN